MQITREFLEEHIVRMTQHASALQGAIEFAQMLVKRLDEAEEPTMTVSQLQEAIKRGQSSEPRESA